MSKLERMRQFSNHHELNPEERVIDVRYTEWDNGDYLEVWTEPATPDCPDLPPDVGNFKYLFFGDRVPPGVVTDWIRLDPADFPKDTK